MKKLRRKARTGNPAKQQSSDRTHDGGQRGGWPGWVRREWHAFFNLPEWLGWLILVLAAGAVLAIWRWLTG